MFIFRYCKEPVPKIAEKHVHNNLTVGDLKSKVNAGDNSIAKNDALLELPKSNNGYFPRRQSKYLKMLQNYTAKSPANYPKPEENNEEVKLNKAKEDLEELTRNVNKFDEGIRKMKYKLGYNKPKQEVVVKKLSEMVEMTTEMNKPREKSHKKEESTSTISKFDFNFKFIIYSI